MTALNLNVQESVFKKEDIVSGQEIPKIEIPEKDKKDVEEMKDDGRLFDISQYDPLQ